MMLYLRTDEILPKKWQIYPLSKLAECLGFKMLIFYLYSQAISYSLSQVHCSFSAANTILFVPRQLDGYNFLSVKQQ